MNNNQNIYQQQRPPQIGQPMMPPPMPPRGQWQRRAMNAIGLVRGISFPKWLSQYGVVVYILALAVVSLMYSTYSLPWYYMLSGVLSIVVFFLYGSHLAERISPIRMRRIKIFEQRIFLMAFTLRVIWMFLIYAIFMQNYGDSFGFENRDAMFYDEIGADVSNAIENGNLFEFLKETSGKIDVSDLGYGVYVGIIYRLTGNSLIAVRFLKCIWSSLIVLLIYRLAKRDFGEQTARIAALFVALWPNFWYYCGTHLKETEMVFLAVLFVEQADQMLRSRQFTAWKVVPVLLIAAAMFTFRTPLGLVALIALVFSVVMSSSRVVSWGKRIIVGFLAIVLVGAIAGNRLVEKSQELIEASKTNQQTGINHYSTRKDASGNQQSFAKYAGSAVFAPMIFTLPFPSMVRPFEGQDVQQLLNGGNLIKNVMSFFTIFALVMLLISGKWRDHLLPLSFMLGYLVVLALSSFAHSERFHQPAMPFEFMFAAYGLSIAVTKPKYKRWFTYWAVLMFVAAIAWNWFKIKGRGLA